MSLCSQPSECFHTGPSRETVVPENNVVCSGGDPLLKFIRRASNIRINLKTVPPQLSKRQLGVGRTVLQKEDSDGLRSRNVVGDTHRMHHRSLPVSFLLLFNVLTAAR